MNQSPRIKRHERAQRRLRRKGQEGLLLTALIDIFANLLFFLLVISQNPNTLPSSKELVLPSSSAEKMPKEQLVVMVTQKDILVQDMFVMSLADATKIQGDIIEPLSKELKYRAQKSGSVPINDKGIAERDITIMGDKNIPYNVLRKVMATCSLNDYARISFAVAHGGKQP